MKNYSVVFSLFLLFFSCKSSPKFLQCETCNGTGEVIVECDECNGLGYFRCRNCNGTGEVECFDCSGIGRVRCNWCYGSGKDGDCIFCSGSGYDDNGSMCVFAMAQEKTIVLHVMAEDIKTVMCVKDMVK